MKIERGQFGTTQDNSGNVQVSSTCASEDGRETFGLPTRKRKLLKMNVFGRRVVRRTFRTGHLVPYREMSSVRNGKIHSQIGGRNELCTNRQALEALNFTHPQARFFTRNLLHIPRQTDEKETR